MLDPWRGLGRMNKNANEGQALLGLAHNGDMVQRDTVAPEEANCINKCAPFFLRHDVGGIPEPDQ
ncbi:hypothetical protein GCM10009095_09670 [Sphingomonas molluscorum]